MFCESDFPSLEYHSLSSLILNKRNWGNDEKKKKRKEKKKKKKNKAKKKERKGRKKRKKIIKNLEKN
jgi:hypothetical protein